jgi:hypothetical protein
VNASVDWLSWGITRFLLRRAESAKLSLLGGLEIAGAVLGTFLSGATLMVLLAALLPNALEGLNVLFGLAKLPRFDWQAMVAKAVSEPWTGGLFVTGMLMTAIVPASSHLVVGLAGVLARLTPGAHTAAETIMSHPEAPLSAKELAPVKLTLIFSRVWYFVAAAIAAGVIAAASWLIWYTHAPVAEFLSNVALGATCWSHGQCVWF